MWTSPTAVPASPTRSVFPNDETDASVIEHEKLERERRRNRWLNRSKDVEKCKSLWDSPCAPAETHLVSPSEEDMSESKTDSGPEPEKLTTPPVAAAEQKYVPIRATKAAESSKSDSKGKSKKRTQMKRRFPLKEQQWMRVSVQKRSEVSGLAKRTPIKVKLKIKTQMAERPRLSKSTSDEKQKSLNVPDKQSFKNDVFARLTRINNRPVKSPTEAIRRVYHKKSEAAQTGPQSRKNLSPTTNARHKRPDLEFQTVQQKVRWFWENHG